ncbi:MAG TPA: hypothetical protein VM532_10705 [Burkholderiales bacterium]|nr:hypothetical protein [Burkholderiales bacterium]
MFAFTQPIGMTSLRCFAVLSLFLGSLSAQAVYDPYQKPPRISRALCSNAAPIVGKWRPDTPGFIIFFVEGLPDPAKVTAQLAKTYGFKVGTEFPKAGIFVVRELTSKQISRLRCERQISYIEYYSGAPIARKEPSVR